MRVGGIVGAATRRRKPKFTALLTCGLSTIRAAMHAKGVLGAAGVHRYGEVWRQSKIPIDLGRPRVRFSTCWSADSESTSEPIAAWTAKRSPRARVDQALKRGRHAAPRSNGI
jgi:hypothetical protein